MNNGTYREDAIRQLHDINDPAYGDAYSEANQIAIKELNDIYHNKIFRYAADLSPFYVGKQWYKRVSSWDYCRISKVDWDFPEIEDIRLYPIVKSIEIEEYKGKTFDVIKTYTIEYPETDNDFLNEWERLEDRDDNY
jgi:hypothetical protein